MNGLGMATIVAAVMCSALLAGCGAPYYQPSYSSAYSSGSSYSSQTSHNKTPSNAIGVEDDPYKPYIEYTSDAAVEGPLGDSTIWVLVARKERATGATVYYTQWGNFYTKDGWRFYFGANDSNASKLEFKEVGREVKSCSYGSCSHTETYNIYFTPEQMAAGAVAGINFKVFAKDSSSKTTSIPASLVKAMWDRVNPPAS